MGQKHLGLASAVTIWLRVWNSARPSFSVVTLRTPLSNFVLTLTSSIVSGRLIEGSKLPKLRWVSHHVSFSALAHLAAVRALTCIKSRG